MTARRLAPLLLAAGAALIATPMGGTMTLHLTSPAFSPGGEIPSRYTCEGEDLAPALSWSGLPEGARRLALSVDARDAPDPGNPQRSWVHWVLYGVPPGSSGLPEGGKPLPPGTREGVNDWKRTGWGGPCPPI